MKKLNRIGLTHEKSGACVTIATFFMEGFSQGNNISQFIVFLRCKRLNGDYGESYKHKSSVAGVFPIALFKNSLQLDTASYSTSNTVTLKSTHGNKLVTFTSTSHWWQQNEVISLLSN